MANRSKIAFSLEPEVLASVERFRARTGESRSAVIGRALKLLTDSEEKAQRVARYVSSYREQPETTRDVQVARRQAKRVLAALPWKDDE
jgi:metal-responsive CopG/Arc/MetJ family transcriptional regulator